MRRYKSLKEELSKEQAEELVKDIKSITVRYAEGDIKYAKSVENKKFKSVAEASKFFSKVPKPDAGYDKHGMIIEFNNGFKLTGFRYDHGLSDPDFEESLLGYLQYNVSMNED